MEPLRLILQKKEVLSCTSDGIVCNPGLWQSNHLIVLHTLPMLASSGDVVPANPSYGKRPQLYSELRVRVLFQQDPVSNHVRCTNYENLSESHAQWLLLRRREIDNQRPGRPGNILRCESGRPRQPDDHHRQKCANYCSHYIYSLNQQTSDT